jgi:uncharacterized protein
LILYCDTSALVKLYVQEQHSEWVRDQVTLSSGCVVCQMTWVETNAAFGMKRRNQEITPAEQRSALKRLRGEWPMFTRMAIDMGLLEEAAEFALRFGLRAYDSVQLACANRAFQQIGGSLAFCCFDKQLNKAAGELGLSLSHPNPQ